jgi:hypothetical protein
MTLISFEPSPPEGLTQKQAEAWLLGYYHGQITGPESLQVVTPYDVDEEADLYEAWADGMDAAMVDAARTQ